jgi:hypothetical protein
MMAGEPTKPIRAMAPFARKVARAAGTLGIGMGVVTVACGGAPHGEPVDVPAGGAQGPVARSAQTPVATVGPTGPLPPSSGDGGISSQVVNGMRSQVVPPDLASVERMCALLTSCDKLPIPRSLVPDDFGSCVRKMSDELSAATAVNFSLTLRECGLQSDSCAGVRSCAMRGASAGACTGRGKQGVVAFCDDSGRALTCWHEQALAVRDCPRGGEQCLVVNGEATCTLGPCGAIAEGDKPQCSASGTHLLHCEKGKLASLDCATFGLKCSTAADGSAGCATGGPPCAAGPVRCEGEVAIACYNGHEVRVDCAAAGLACEQGAGGATPVGACVAPASPSGACDPAEKAKCEDGSIKYCAAGRPRAYSCKSVGFNRCDASKEGIRCVP